MAKKEGVPFLGRLPIDSSLVELLDGGEPGEISECVEFPLMDRYRETPSFSLFQDITSNVLLGLTKGNMENGKIG